MPITGSSTAFNEEVLYLSPAASSRYANTGSKTGNQSEGDPEGWRLEQEASKEWRPSNEVGSETRRLRSYQMPNNWSPSGGKRAEARLLEAAVDTSSYIHTRSEI